MSQFNVTDEYDWKRSVQVYGYFDGYVFAYFEYQEYAFTVCCDNLNVSDIQKMFEW